MVVRRSYHHSENPGPRFNIKMTSYQYRKSHCGDKTIWRPSYLHNGISYSGKMTSLYWIRAQTVMLIYVRHRIGPQVIAEVHDSPGNQSSKKHEDIWPLKSAKVLFCSHHLDILRWTNMTKYSPQIARWRGMETYFVLRALCEGNPPKIG